MQRESKMVQKATKNLIIAALILQIIYLLNTLFANIFPKAILPLFGYFGNYDIPFLAWNVLDDLVFTILFAVVCLVLLQKTKKDQYVGVGWSVVLGIYIVIQHILGIIWGIAASYMTQNLIDKMIGQENCSLTATIGENISGLTYIEIYCNWAAIISFIALLLLVAAYSIYRFYCKTKRWQQNCNICS